MRDPFFAAPAPLVQATKTLANSLALRTLPLHVHEILFAFCTYQCIKTVVAPRVSGYLFPDTYTKLSKRAKINWDVHFVSMIQACVINSAAIWVMYVDLERRNMDWKERIWGYSGATGMVQAFSAGYFLWDLLTSAKDIDVHGPGALAHAACALAVSSLGFRPFLNYYGLNFILYELSTPFVNIHWFLDKVGMTGSKLQLYNGIALIASFGGCRLVWGNYQSFRMYQDVWRAIQNPGELPVPPWLAVAYMASVTILSALNFYWFGRMIRTVRSRFEKPKAGVPREIPNGKAG
ncbi:MAG: hypothetical protein Q9187_007766 [Circinaria calcarea]